MRITAELKAATRDAAATLKDLQRAMKSARMMVDDYIDEQFADRLRKLDNAVIGRAAEIGSKFVDDFAAERAKACETAKAHMVDDWRLACAVNTVGHQVWEALHAADILPEQDAHTHPELKDDLVRPSWSPKGESNV
jgi:hypothetical protein